MCQKRAFDASVRNMTAYWLGDQNAVCPPHLIERSALFPTWTVTIEFQEHHFQLLQPYEVCDTDSIKFMLEFREGKQTLSEIQSNLLSLLLKPQFDPAPTQWKQPQGHQSRSTKSVINYWDRLSVLTVRTQLRYIPIQHLTRLIPWHCFRFCTAS